VVGIGGIIGAILRFLIYKWFLSAGHIPLTGTLFVNLLGCFFLGYLQGLARVYELPNWLVTGIGTGIIGAFTTFSTFSMDVVSSFVQGYVVLSLTYLLASAVGGYILVRVGFSLSIMKKKDVR
jgi:CrcB protein